MNFSDSINNVFANYATIRGRSPRSEYWYFALFFVGTYIAAIILDNALGNNFIVPETGERAPFGWCTLLTCLALLLPTWCLAARRFHDLDKSAWSLLLLCIPFVNIYFAILILFVRGTVGANRFGNDPLGLAPLEARSFDEPRSSPPLQDSANVPSAKKAPDPAKQTVNPSPINERLDLLEKLGKLRDDGILTQSEFEAKKAEILR